VIVAELARYLMSDESAALAGPHWRDAFRALAAIDVPAQAELQKGLLVGLVRTADERAAVLRGARGLARLADALERNAETVSDFEDVLSSGEPVVRGVVGAALSQLIDALGRGERSLPPEPLAKLCVLVGNWFAKDTGAPPEVVTGLQHLAFHGDEAVALSARDALFAMVQPRDPAFWRSLGEDSRHPAPQGMIVEAIGRFDLEAAFDHLRRDVIESERALAVAYAALVEALGALEREHSHVLHDRYAGFLAELGPADRQHLISAPADAGLDWTAASLDRPLGQRFFSVLACWTGLLDSPHGGPQVERQVDRQGRKLAELARSTLLRLDTGEQRRARELLRERIGTKAGAAVSVPALLTAGWDEEVARALVELCRYDEDPAERMADWYFEICPRDALSTEHQAALIAALYDAVAHDEAPLLAVARRGAEEQSELDELYENPGIPAITRVTVESALYNSRHGDPRPGLLLIADSAGRSR
jgi:hypothetical protein